MNNKSNDGSRRKLQFCVALYNPVTCLLSGVEFPSRCDAEMAGYDAGDCTAPKHPEMDCPSSNDKPVKCGEDNEIFPNICMASEDGYDPPKDCTSAASSAAAPLSGRPGNTRNEDTFTVATVGTSRCITKKVKPVKCGPNLDVEFEKMCEARAAGYKRSECVRA
jgi:hypothetical protein